ncbi:MAG: hydrogenase maturation nickel metallochaperone HypA [Tepidisphaerales bacterium]
MHEYSLAEALLKQVISHAPPGAKVERVVIEAGPLQGIEPYAMQTGWQLVTRDTSYARSVLEIVELPWPLHCPGCGRDWTSPAFPATCSCGCADSHPTGGSDLLLKSITIAD